MKIELKNIYVNQRMSRETTLFEADIYIDGLKAGFAENEGRGGQTNIQGIGEKGRQLIEAAEAYCKKLPDKVEEYEVNDKKEKYKMKMSLEVFVDDLLEAFLNKKEMARFQKRMDKDMLDSILYGVPGSLAYTKLQYRYPMEKMLSTPAFRAGFMTSIANKILPSMKKGEKILNTNIHPEQLAKLGVPADRLLPVEPEVKRLPTSPRVKGPEKKKGGKRP